MSDQTRREAGEDFRIVGLLQPAFLQVIIVVRPTARIFGGTGTGGSSRTAFKSIAGDCPRLLPMRNRSAPCAISSGRVPGNPPSRCVRPCQPEPSSAAIPGTPPVSKLTMRMSYLQCVAPPGGIEWLCEQRRLRQARCCENQCANVASHSDLHVKGNLRCLVEV